MGTPSSRQFMDWTIEERKVNQHTDKKENEIFLIYKEIQSHTVYEKGLLNI
jgi:hypothetical protein